MGGAGACGGAAHGGGAGGARAAARGAARLLDAGDGHDAAPLLLFDLNGTLTSHTAVRRGAGCNRMRPGTHHLRRLQVCVFFIPTTYLYVGLAYATASCNRQLCYVGGAKVPAVCTAQRQQ
jgi:hypothetical protein